MSPAKKAAADAKRKDSETPAKKAATAAKRKDSETPAKKTAAAAKRKGPTPAQKVATALLRKERSSLSKQNALSGSNGSCARRIDDEEDFEEEEYENVYHRAPIVSVCVSTASDLSFSEEADYAEVPTIVFIRNFFCKMNFCTHFTQNM